MRINREIRAEKVRVIGEQGEQIGVLTIREALVKAEEAGLDLVEIAPLATPPVCKIIDYGKFRYLQIKKEKESKKLQHQVKVKEIKLKPNIDEHDFQTKVKQCRDFIVKGNKVRVTCVFRGRELLHVELGDKLVKQLIESLQDVAMVETPAKFLGRMISGVLAPLGKKTNK